jgi:hypothetical protein
MINSNKNLARIVGVLILGESVIGFLINEVLAGPYTFSKDFLTSVSAHSTEMTIAMLLGFVSGVISISIAALLLPIFKKQSETGAYAYLAFSIVSFAAIIIDNVSIQSMLALSKEFVHAPNPHAHHFQTVGAIAYATRSWTHLMTLLVACLPLSVFYYLLFTSKLTPRFISIWGLIGLALMALAVLLMIFNRGSYLLLFAPFGLNQLFLVVWLLVRGFRFTLSSHSD